MRWWLRVYLVFAAVQGLGIGLTGVLTPAEMQIPLRLSPLNARFVASLYVAGGLGLLLVAFRKQQRDARLFVLGFGLATGLILALTLLHWGDFMADELPHRPIWLFDYLVDPVLAAAIVLVAGFLPIRDWTRDELSPIFGVEAAVLGVLGLVLVLAPGLAVAVWPWALPAVAGQLYGCFFLTFAVGAALAGGETWPTPRRIFTLTTLLLFVLVLAVSLIHVDRFKAEPVTWVWFGACVLGALAFGGVLINLQRSASKVIGVQAGRPV